MCDGGSSFDKWFLNISEYHGLRKNNALRLGIITRQNAISEYGQFSSNDGILNDVYYLLKKLYDNKKGKVVNYVNRYILNPDDIDNITDSKKYICKTAYNVSVQYYRKKLMHIPLDEKLHSKEGDLERIIDKKQLVKIVFQFINNLPPVQGQILFIKFRFGFSLLKVSKLLDIDYKAVKSQYTTAMKRIKALVMKRKLRMEA